MTGDPARGPSTLLTGGVRAVNIGLAGFAEPIRTHGGACAQVEWRPPAEGDRALGLLLARLEDDPDDPFGAQVARANAEAVRRIVEGRPVAVDVRTAVEAIPGMGARTLLHAGPPITWERMCGPMRGAAIGAMLLEGWAATPAEAEALADRGAVEFAPCHEHATVGPMAGIVSPSMPVIVVENQAFGNRAFSNLNEGIGKMLRYGAYDEAVLERLRWFAATLGPALGRTLRASPVDLRDLTARALQMGDECHNRNVAGTSILIRTIAPALVRAAPDDAAAALEFMRGNDHFYLNFSMAACKATLDAAHGIDGSTVVTAMARNGVEFGIRVGGTGGAWFTAPAGVPDGLYFPGYGAQDANPDIGDSAITETCGIGGFAMAAAPAIVRFIGGTPADAIAYTRAMYRITLTRSQAYGIPSLGFAGTPTAIDVRRVVESGVVPIIDTGIAHRLPGMGQIGAGITAAPYGCFTAALRALGRRLGLEEAA